MRFINPSLSGLPQPLLGELDILGRAQRLSHGKRYLNIHAIDVVNNSSTCLSLTKYEKEHKYEELQTTLPLQD